MIPPGIFSPASSPSIRITTITPGMDPKLKPNNTPPSHTIISTI